MRVTQGNIWNLLPSPQCPACGGSPSTRGGSLTSATVPPHNSLPTLSLQSLGRFCQAAVSLVGAPPVYVQCISRILVGQGDHGDPPPPQHAWSFTGSNKPTLYSKEKFGSNKPAFRQWHFKPFWVKTTWALRFTGGSQAHNISTTQSCKSSISKQHASSIFLVPRWNRVYGDTRSNVNTLWPPSSPKT